jgi:hypothetical protein
MFMAVISFWIVSMVFTLGSPIASANTVSEEWGIALPQSEELQKNNYRKFIETCSIEDFIQLQASQELKSGNHSMMAMMVAGAVLGGDNFTRLTERGIAKKIPETAGIAKLIIKANKLRSQRLAMWNEFIDLFIKKFNTDFGQNYSINPSQRNQLSLIARSQNPRDIPLFEEILRSRLDSRGNRLTPGTETYKAHQSKVDLFVETLATQTRELPSFKELDLSSDKSSFGRLTDKVKGHLDTKLSFDANFTEAEKKLMSPDISQWLRGHVEGYSSRLHGYTPKAALKQLNRGYDLAFDHLHKLYKDKALSPETLESLDPQIKKKLDQYKGSKVDTKSFKAGDARDFEFHLRAFFQKPINLLSSEWLSTGRYLRQMEHLPYMEKLTGNKKFSKSKIGVVAAVGLTSAIATKSMAAEGALALLREDQQSAFKNFLVNKCLYDPNEVQIILPFFLAREIPTRIDFSLNAEKLKKRCEGFSINWQDLVMNYPNPEISGLACHLMKKSTQYNLNPYLQKIVYYIGDSCQQEPIRRDQVSLKADYGQLLQHNGQAYWQSPVGDQGFVTRVPIRKVEGVVTFNPEAIQCFTQHGDGLVERPNCSSDLANLFKTGVRSSDLGSMTAIDPKLTREKFYTDGLKVVEAANNTLQTSGLRFFFNHYGAITQAISEYDGNGCLEEQIHGSGLNTKKGASSQGQGI